MNFWIYNYGIAVPLSEQSLQIENKTQALDKLSRSSRTHGFEEENGHMLDKSPNPNSLKTSTSITSKFKTNQETNRHQVFFAEQIMSSPVATLNSNMSFNTAWSYFKEKRLRHFPVMNKDQKLVGIISDRDMMLAFSASQNQIKNKSEDYIISKIMKNDVLTASTTTNIREICRVMFNQHVGSIPITDGQGALLGILTRSDILRTMIKNEPLELWV